MKRTMDKVLTLFIIQSIALFISCEKPVNSNLNSRRNILAQVGNKIITVNDFIKRCEYVPRPAYCKGDNYIHKKIALNSLIAEKLLAIDFEKQDYQLTESQNYIILGQKEQAMRHLMLKQFGYDHVVLDTAIINNIIKLSKRKYKLNFIVLDQQYKEIIQEFNSLNQLNELKMKLSSNVEITERTITKNDNMLNEIRDILYFNQQKLNTMYGPFVIDEKNIICFEIVGWTTSTDITEKEKTDTWEREKNDYIERNALNIYSDYVAQIMKGKTIRYNPNTMDVFSNKLAKIYLIEKEKKEGVIENRIWGIKEEIEFATYENINLNKNDILLTHDSKSYTIEEILILIKKHPLVFRNKNTNLKSFKNELKYAIADLFRDMHITNKAYLLGLVDDLDILNIENKWSDHIKAITLKKKFEKKSETKKIPSISLIKKIDSLQNYYSGIIKIDTDRFENINLSKIDMNVIFLNQAYSKLEPDFPILTNDHILDYGQKFLND